MFFHANIIANLDLSCAFVVAPQAQCTSGCRWLGEESQDYGVEEIVWNSTGRDPAWGGILGRYSVNFGR